MTTTKARTKRTEGAPESVAIVAMGASCADYMNKAARAGGRRGLVDEVWAINAMGGIIEHDRLFAMDDTANLRFQRDQLKTKVATGMLRWLEAHPGPVYMPRDAGGVPGFVEYPLLDVLNDIGFPYLNNTVSYAVAFAIWSGVKRIALYGCDFTYPDLHRGGSGRGNVEWLLGIAATRGIRVEVSSTTTLLDGNKPTTDRLYGYPNTIAHHNGERWTLIELDENGQAPITDVGGGWYELPNGDRVQGHKAVEEALRRMGLQGAA